MSMSVAELTQCLHYQIAALDGMAKVQGLTLSYVKPHGALYNDMMNNQQLLSTVMGAVASYPANLKLMILATADAKHHHTMARHLGLTLVLEAFADRLYTDQGHLVARNIAGSVHDKAALLAQVKQLLASNSVTTQSGKSLKLNADSICVHGDNAQGVALIEDIKALCSASV